MTDQTINAKEFVGAARALALLSKYQKSGEVDLMGALSDPQNPIEELLNAVLPGWQELSIEELIGKVPAATERVTVIAKLLESLRGQASAFTKPSSGNGGNGASNS